MGPPSPKSLPPNWPARRASTPSPPAGCTGSNGCSGPHPVSVPGISAERSLALASGATSLGYGEYSVRAGQALGAAHHRRSSHGEDDRVVSAVAAADDVLAVASELARQVSRARRPLAQGACRRSKHTWRRRSPTPPPTSRENLEQAMAADPDSDRRLLFAGSIQDPAAGPRRRRGSAQPRAGACRRHAARRRRYPPGGRSRQTSIGDFSLSSHKRPHHVGRAPTEMIPPLGARSPNPRMTHRQYPQAVQAYRKLLEVEPEDVNGAEPARLCSRICG